MLPFIFLVILSIQESNGQLLPGRNLAPVVLVPGYSRSQIRATLDKPSVVQPNCVKKRRDEFTLWVDYSELTPQNIDCLSDNLRLIWNNETKTTSNSPGVMTRVPDFGHTRSVEYLSPFSGFPFGAQYFGPLVNFFVLNSVKGYARGSNLRAAPYDHRRVTNEMEEWFNRTQVMIEETVRNNGQRVVLVGHSEGGMIAYAFLKRMSLEWKDQNIHRYISMGSPYGGTSLSLVTYALGNDNDPVTGGLLREVRDRIRKTEWTYPALPFMMPNSNVFPPDHVLIYTDDGPITISQYDKFYQFFNDSVGYEMWKEVKDEMGDLSHPQVNVSCYNAFGFPTIKSLDYRNAENPMKPKIIMGDGDIFVDQISSDSCLRWASNKEYDFASRYYFMEHNQLIQNPIPLTDLFNEITLNKYSSN